MPRNSTKPKPAKLPPVSPTAARDSLRDIEVHFPPVKIFNPDGSLTIRPGKPVVLSGGDWIGTAEAARTLGCSQSWVESMCDRGKLLPDVDWRRIGKRGNYRIKRASILALRSEVITP